MKQLELDDYHIHLGHIGQSLPALFQGSAWSAIFILADEHTRVHCLPKVAPLLPGRLRVEVLEIPAGEIHKTIRTCERIWSEMLHAGADRGALLLNLGGGVIGDMGGFCAATYKRGIDFIQIPTTLLSQVDASIGGKLGIDFGEVKNSVGVFRNPFAVCIDPDFLSTLPERELRSGFAEMIKHALIADAGQWEAFVSGDPVEQMSHPDTIWSSLKIKQAIVQADPFEKGLRKALNFGHTVGHAVESWSLNSESPLLHGEAIAIGMIAEARLSQQYAGLTEGALRAICNYILNLYNLPALPVDRFEDYLALMRNDKKNAGGKINCTLLEAPGRALINQYVPEEGLLEGLHYFNRLR